jgi:hypothetical protein
MPASRHGEQELATPSRRRQLSGRSLPPVQTAYQRPVILGFLVFFIILALLFHQLHTRLADMESSLATEAVGGGRLDAMGQQMEVLRNRLHGLLADSVEIRLKSLERDISLGKVSTEDLRLFDTLQNDLKALENYSSMAGSIGIDEAVREHPRYQSLALASGKAIAHGEMLNEISRLRVLLYLCLTGLIAGGVVLAGRYWVESRRQSALLPPKVSKPALLGRRR